MPTNIFDMLDLWNNAGVNWNAIKMNVNNQASMPDSQIMDLQTNGISQFGVHFSKGVQVGLPTGAYIGPGAVNVSDAYYIDGVNIFQSPVFTGDARAVTPPFGDNDESIPTTFWVHREYAPLASPLFTGNPRAPTAVLGDATNSIATTLFATTADQNLQNFTVAQLALKANINSPLFSGDPRAPVPPGNDNSQSIATTGWVKLQGYTTQGAVDTGLAGKQPLDGDLTAISALTGVNTIYYRSALDTWSPVLIGANLTFAGGTLSAAGGGGPAGVTAVGTPTPGQMARWTSATTIEGINLSLLGIVTAAAPFASDNHLIRSDGTALAVQGSALALSDAGEMSFGVDTPIVAGGTTPVLQILGLTSATSQILLGRYSNDTNTTRLRTVRSRSGVTGLGLGPPLQAGDGLFELNMMGVDNAGAYQNSALIASAVDGAVAGAIVPGRIVMATVGVDSTALYTRMQMDSTGIKLSSPVSTVPFAVTIEKDWTAGAGAQAMLACASYGDGARITLMTANGSKASPLPVLFGNPIGSYGFRGWHSGGAFAPANIASMTAFAWENWTATAQASLLGFYTTPIGGQSSIQRMTIQPDGQVRVIATLPSAVPTDGALTVAGGVGIQGALNVGTSIMLSVPAVPQIVSTNTPVMQILGQNANTSQMLIGRFSADINPPRIRFVKSRGVPIGLGGGAAQVGDSCGQILFHGEATNGQWGGTCTIDCFMDDPVSGFGSLRVYNGVAETIRMDSLGAVSVGLIAPPATLRFSVGVSPDNFICFNRNGGVPTLASDVFLPDDNCIHFIGKDSASTMLLIDEYGTGGNGQAGLSVRAAGGTLAAPVHKVKNDALGAFTSYGYRDAATPGRYQGCASIHHRASENHSVAGTPGMIVLRTAGLTGSTVDRVSVDHLGALLVSPGVFNPTARFGIGIASNFFELNRAATAPTPLTETGWPTDGAMHFTAKDGDPAALVLESHVNPNGSCILAGRASAGTLAARTPTPAGASLMLITALGYTQEATPNYSFSSTIQFRASIAHSVGSVPGMLAFRTADTTGGTVDRITINHQGTVVVGGATALTNVNSSTPALQVMGQTSSTAQIFISRFSPDSNSPRLRLGKSRSATMAMGGAVQVGDVAGEIAYYSETTGGTWGQTAIIAASVDDPASGFGSIIIAAGSTEVFKGSAAGVVSLLGKALSFGAPDSGGAGKRTMFIAN